MQRSEIRRELDRARGPSGVGRWDADLCGPQGAALQVQRLGAIRL